ncbi:MAG TPA: SLC13 family permease [Bacteroidales bacterium]|jgi:di/tricarboxylate transporter|nr:SLC13 family permease [Bacteroidales bacterium]
MITFDLLLMFVVLLFILISLYWNILGISFTFLIGVITLGIFGILTPTEILSGFGNEQVAVVILMLLFSDVIKKTDIIEFSFDRLFRKVKTYKGFISRMVLAVSAFSMFLNNTPLVAVMMPYVNSWSKRNNMAPSKFLIPLSYAAILGGSATLIGTSTNLIVNSMVIEQDIMPGLAKLDLFEFAWVGIPMMIIGFLYLVFFGNKLLPSKATIEDDLNAGREYVVEAKVRTRSHLIGKSVGESGMLDIKGLTLTAIVRKSITILEVPHDVILDQGDVLVFKGETRNITELLSTKSGLVVPEVGMLSHLSRANVNEVVVSQNSSLTNKSVRDTDFRGKYDAAIIAVHRNGERLGGKPGSVVLKAGDVLLLFAGENFLRRVKDTFDFYFISRVTEYINLQWYKTLILIVGTALVITLAAMSIISLFMGLILMILISMILKVTTPREIPNSVDYNLALVIVLSLALGTAMIKSGAAEIVANGVISAFLPLGKTGVLFGVYIITAILAAYITTKAAVAIVFPVALSVAQLLGVSGTPFVLAVAYAAACTFITPHGYVTNLMVYGPGGYNFRDFMRAGLPLTIIYMVVAVLILSAVYF